MRYTLDDHIERSFSRLSASEYQIQNLFQPDTYDWPGDWEGRHFIGDKMLVQKEDGEKVLLCDLALGENSPKKYLVMYK